jgi:glycosyltransferase involved in cell wall biosynthesis
MYPTAEEPWFGCFVREQVEDLISLGVDLRLLHFDGRGDPLNYFRAARRVRRIVSTEHYDLVHAHYGLTGAVAAFQNRVPTVTTFHGSDYSGEIRWQKYVSWIVARRSFPIVVSEEGRRLLMQPSAPVIPAGVDTELFAPIDRHEARRRLGWVEGGRYVLLPGSRSAPKQPLLFDAALAEARKTVPDLRGVEFSGFSREQAALVFNAVDVTLMTSRREGSPVAVRESLACMTPVVSVPVGDVPKVLAGLPGCGIFPRKPQALGKGVVDALGADRSPALRRRAERYSRRRTAERLAAVYRSVAAGR